MPTEVAGSSWDSVCISVGMSAAPEVAVGMAPAPVGVVQPPSHREPQMTASGVNATSERSVSQREHRERYERSR